MLGITKIYGDRTRVRNDVCAGGDSAISVFVLLWARPRRICRDGLRMGFIANELAQRG